MSAASAGTVLAVAASLLLGSGASVASAATAPERVEVSVDGVHWAPALPGPLFDPSTRWVPGDTRTASFYFRTSADAGRTWIAMTATDPDQLMARGDLHIEAHADGATWQPLAGTGQPQRIGSAQHGQAVPVTVRATLDWSAENISQLSTADLAFTVLAEGVDEPETPGVTGPGMKAPSAPGTNHAPSHPSGKRPALAMTGVAGLGQALGWGLVLVAIGFLMRARPRRKGQSA